MVDTSSIKRRVAQIERQILKITRILGFIPRWLGIRRKVNAKSREMTKEESSTFIKQMAAHGLEDGESGSSVGVEHTRERK